MSLTPIKRTPLFDRHVTRPTPPTLAAAVGAQLERIAVVDDEFERVRQLGDLLSRLAEQVDRVTRERDQALIAILTEHTMSTRALAAEFGISHQRVSQLSAHARAGRRPPRTR